LENYFKIHNRSSKFLLWKKIEIEDLLQLIFNRDAFLLMLRMLKGVDMPRDTIHSMACMLKKLEANEKGTRCPLWVEPNPESRNEKVLWPDPRAGGRRSMLEQKGGWVAGRRDRTLRSVKILAHMAKHTGPRGRDCGVRWGALGAEHWDWGCPT